MAPEIIRKIELTGGEKGCHRKPAVLLPTTLGQFELLHPPCIRDKCTLWNPALEQCYDLTTAQMSVEIAKSLDSLVELAEVLASHAGEK